LQTSSARNFVPSIFGGFTFQKSSNIQEVGARFFFLFLFPFCLPTAHTYKSMFIDASMRIFHCFLKLQLMVSRCKSGWSTDQQLAGNNLWKRTQVFGQQHHRKKMAFSCPTRCLPHHTSMSIYNERHPEKRN
jgi:hypothetical protein